MKKFLVAALVASALIVPTAQARADAGGAFIGGLIIGNILTQPRTIYVQPAPVYIPPPPVYINPNPYGVQPNPYLYQIPRQCHLENFYDGAGYLIGQRQVCN
jgi:hypothetical protein